MYKRSWFPRVKNEFFCEPRWSVDQLPDVEEFRGSVHDMACGSGTIPSVFLSRGIPATGSDLVDRGFGTVQDFFTDNTIHDNRVSNVPYGRAEPFLRRSLELTRYKVCLLRPISFLKSQCRVDLYERFPPVRVWVFSTRPSIPPGIMPDGNEERDEHGAVIQPEGQGGMTPFGWFVWEIGYHGPITLKRLPTFSRRRLRIAA